MNSNEALIWWVASVSVICVGVLCAVFSRRRQTYLAGLVAAASGSLGMLYALRLIVLGGI